MPSKAADNDIPTLKARNVVLRRVLTTRYGSDLGAHPVEVITFHERTLKEVADNHPHPAARATAATVLRLGERSSGLLGMGRRVAMPMGIGAALVVVAAIYDAVADDERAGRFMLDEAVSVERAIRERYDVTEEEVRSTVDAIVAA